MVMGGSWECSRGGFGIVLGVFWEGYGRVPGWLWECFGRDIGWCWEVVSSMFIYVLVNREPRLRSDAVHGIYVSSMFYLCFVNREPIYVTIYIKLR